MLLMVKKGIKGGLGHYVKRYAKTNNKHMKDYGKNKDSSYLKYWNANDLHGWAMSQKLPVNGFKWVDDFSDFKLKKKDKEKSNERYFLEFNVQYLKIYMNFTMNYRFCLIQKKLIKSKKLEANLRHKK